MQKRPIWRKLLTLLLILGAILFASILVLEVVLSGKEIPVSDIAIARPGRVDIRLFNAGVRLRNTELLDRPGIALTGSVQQLEIGGINAVALLLRKEFRMKFLRIDEMECMVHTNRLGDRVDTTVADMGPDGRLSFRLASLESSFDGVMTPDVHLLEVRNVRYRPGKGKYDIDVGSISSLDGIETIAIDSFLLMPRFSKDEFARILGYRTGRLDVMLPVIRIAGFNIQRLLRDSILEIRHVDVPGGEVGVFTDKRVPVATDRYVHLPVQDLLASEQQLMIDSITAHRVVVTYTTLHPVTEEEGYIRFNNAAISLTNLTNISSRIAADPSMHVDLWSHIERAGILSAQLDFALDRLDMQYYCTGSLTQTDLTFVNTLSEPAMNVRIESGQCDELRFNFTADSARSQGTVDFAYTDLEITALEKEEHKDRKFISDFSNTFLIRGSNVPGSPHYKQGKIDYAHEWNRDIIHYIWTSIQVGIEHSILPESVADAID